ncbi:CopD family protein [Streptomyces sp. NPDC048415]|uniref:CopD family protein n=1 Tax=Streptomyces sp. NPDC048415 TaxID=3154822 RepID=UPI003449802A
MTLIRPAAEVAGESEPARRRATGRAVAVLALVAVAALIPLLGPRAALQGTGEAAAPGVAGIAVLRAVLLAALCVAAGELFAARLGRRVPGAPLEHQPRSWAACCAAAGFVAALGLASVVATGNLLPHHLSDMDVGGLYRTRDGKLALLEVNAFAVAWLCARSRRPATQGWPLAAVVVAEALRAHPSTEHNSLLGSGLTLIHLTCAALWAGSLLHVLRTLRKWRPSGTGSARPSGTGSARPSGTGSARPSGTGSARSSEAGAVPASKADLARPSEAGAVPPSEARAVPPSEVDVARPSEADVARPSHAGIKRPSEAGVALLGLYARVAAVLLAVITATGTWSALRRMPPGTVLDQLTATAYGRALLAKLLVVAVVAVLALSARLRLRRAADPLSAYSPARAEVVALGVVVTVSGALTALPLPIRW